MLKKTILVSLAMALVLLPGCNEPEKNDNMLLLLLGLSGPAMQVYGQGGSFTSNTANNGGISADSLGNPADVAADAGGVYIVDQGNNRVLYYSGTSTTATRVYGQGGSFTSNTGNKGGISADSLYFPNTIAVDAGGVYIVDGTNNRVLYYPGTSTTATRVYGQGGSFSSSAAGTTATSLNGPNGIAMGAGGVFISEGSNNRVLYFFGTDTTATRVYGQGGSFTSNAAGTTSTSLNYPTGVTVDAGGVYISEYYNNRVMYYSGTSTTATRVYGQGGSFTTGTGNNGGVSADSLFGPEEITVVNDGIYIPDYANNRILYYSGTSTTASRVYGQQESFTTRAANKGGIGAATLYNPTSIAVHAGRVYIADYENNRVLKY